MDPPPQNPLDVLTQLQNQLAALQQTVNTQNDTIQQQQNQLAAIPMVPPAQIQMQPPRIKPDRPSPFSGKRAENLEAWIFQMQQFCELAPIPDDDHIAFAATFFKDQAALWW